MLSAHCFAVNKRIDIAIAMYTIYTNWIIWGHSVHILSEIPTYLLISLDYNVKKNLHCMHE